MSHGAAELTNRSAEHMMSLRERALSERKIDSATKALVMAAIYTAVRCRDCVQG